MKAFDILICAFLGVVISGVATFGAWYVQIEPRAFQCWDGPGIEAYWESIEVHEGAGDKISTGWTWDEIKTWRAIYLLAFFGIWVGSSAGIYRQISRQSRRPDPALESTGTAPVSSTKP